MLRRAFLFLMGCVYAYSVQAQFSLTSLSYTQDFNTLANTGTSSTLPAGWFLSETGTGANTLYAAGSGTGTTGDTYSFGTVSAVDRAFGALQSGSVVPTIGFYFTNNTGSTITALSIQYSGEQWRMGAAGRVDQLDFQYSSNATALNNGTWTDANTLDFIAPITAGAVAALDGNLAANRTNISSLLSGLSIAAGSSFSYAGVISTPRAPTMDWASMILRSMSPLPVRCLRIITDRYSRVLGAIWDPGSLPLTMAHGPLLHPLPPLLTIRSSSEAGIPSRSRRPIPRINAPFKVVGCWCWMLGLVLTLRTDWVLI